MSIAYFPGLFTNETFDSFLGRYRRRTFKSRSQALITLFGKSQDPHRNFPKLTPQLIEIFNCFSIVSERFIKDHTAFSYFSNLLGKECSELLYNHLFDKASVPMNVLQWHVKSCPLCTVEDLDLIGETYWRTWHNLPLIQTCVKHDCRLKTFYNREFGEYTPSSDLAEMEIHHNSNAAVREFDLKLLDFLYDRESINHLEIFELARKESFIKQGENGYNIKSEYLNEFNNYVNSLFAGEIILSRSTIEGAFNRRPSLRSYPEIYLLLRNFLQDSPNWKDIIKATNGNDGQAHQCINPICDSYKKAISNPIFIKSRLYGHVLIECPECNLIYSSKSKRRFRVVDLGGALQDEIKNLANQGVSLIDISKKLGISKEIAKRVIKNKYIEYKTRVNKLRKDLDNIVD